MYKPNLDNLQSYLQNNSGGGSDIKWWSLPLGTSTIRVLPPWDATGMIALAVYQHRIEYTEPGSQFSKYNWTCVDRTFGRPCNICQGLKELREAGINTEQYEANSRNFYINALVVQDANQGRSPDAVAPNTHVLMRIPKTVYDWIVTQITNPVIGDITDVNSGIDIMITKSGSGLSTTYVCTMSPNGRQPINPEVLSKLELYNISDIFNTGFEDQRIQGLISTLRNASINMGGSVAVAQQQMNTGYPQFMQQQMTPQSYQQPVTPNPAYNPVPQPQYTQPVVPPTPPTVNPNPVVPANMNLNAQQPNAVYQPQQQQVVPPSPYQAPIPGSQPQTQPVQTQVGTPQSVMQQPVQQAITMPQQQPMPQQPVVQNTAANPANAPTCFGHYDDASVNCITCPFEADCIRSTNRG